MDNDTLRNVTSSAEATDQRGEPSVRELLNVIMEKDRLLKDLLERLISTTSASSAAAESHAVTTFQVMPDLSKNILTFDGSEDAASAREWVENLRRTATLHKWPSSFLLESAKSHITGAAKDWLRSRSADITSWEEFENHFRRTFVSQTRAAERWRRMQDRVQQRSESTTAYLHSKVRLCKEAGLDFCDTREQVITGLRSRQLSTMLLGKTHDDDDDLLHDIQEFERIDRERQERFGGPRDKKSITDAASTQDPSAKYARKTGDARSTTDKRPPLSNERGERKCYNCNQYGHMARDCPQPKRPLRCLRCNGTDHTQRHCREAAQRERNEANTVSEPSKETTSVGVLLKQVILNDKFSLIGLIDTGSSSCLLRASAAARCGTELVEKSTPLYGFGNISVPVSRSIGGCKADIKIDGVLAKDVPIFVVPDEAQAVDLLVGRTFTELPYLTYARVGGCLRFWRLSDCPFAHLEPFEHHQKLQLKAREESILQKDSVNWITLTADERVTGPVIYRHCGMDVLVDMTLGEVTIPMYPASNDEIVIRKGQPLGRAKQVEILQVDVKDTSEVHIGRDKNKANEVERRPIMGTEVNIGPAVTEVQQSELVELLNEFRECFAMTPSELGCTSVVEMDIVETPGSTPFSVRPYRTNAEGRETIRKIVKEWKDLGVVTETTSDYASPVLVVDKKNGEKRMVVDYRRLNAQTVKEKYPLPNIDDQFEELAGATLYTVLDLAHGYLQVPLKEEAKRKTAFVTPDETGQFERMMFGLTNAPAVFQRLMNRVLGPLRGRVVMCYLDDVLIPAQDWNDMIHRLRQVLQALKDAKLTLRLSKCAFAKDSVDFLGFRLSGGQMQPGEAKIDAIAQFPIPRDVHDVRRFLGLSGFFRKFVPKYALIAEPLTRLTKKDAVFEWETEQENSFQDLKRRLTSKPVLQLFDSKAETELHTDASSKGLAGMLLQRKDNKWHLVYCVSKKTTEAESKYHSTRLELMAIVWSVDRLRSLLLGIHFTVVTDCQALVYLNAQRTQKPQIARWYDLIQEFDFTIRHRPGIQMMHVDSLSRQPVEGSSDTMDDILEGRFEVCLTCSLEDQILAMQRGDEEMRQLFEILEKPEDLRTKEDKSKAKGYALKDGKLMYTIDQDKQRSIKFVLPKAMRKAVVVQCHDLLGHFSVDRTVAKMQETFWFPRMRNYVRKHISQCFECIFNKVPGGRKEGLLNPIPPGKRPFETVHLDHMGPFVPSRKRNQHLLVIVDNLTKFVRLFATRDTSSKHVLLAMEEFILERGLPKTIITDRGSCFTSRAFEEFCTTRTIQHVLNSSRHPQANGQVERVNRTVLPVITTAMKDPDHRDWDVKLKRAECSLNNAVNKSTGKTPFEMLHGYKPSFYGIALQELALDDEPTWTNPSELRVRVRQRLLKEQEKSKQAYDRRHYPAKLYDVGEVVFMRRSKQHTGNSTKTQPKYRGPLVVTQVLPADTYRVANLDQSSGSRFATTAHVSQLKGWSTTSAASHLDDDVASEDSGENQEEPPAARPIRKRALPARLRDCEM